jgi:hypothetical protein
MMAGPGMKLMVDLLLAFFNLQAVSSLMVAGVGLKLIVC